jgi:parallel beta-helix repeat protein
MKPNILIILLCLVLGMTANATTYYFAANGSDLSTTPTNPNTPYQTLGKLTTLFPSLHGGDSVLLRRGDTFTGSFTVGASGTATAPIVISAYGTGARPVITGLTTLTGWTLIDAARGIWESASNTSLRSTLSTVLLNGNMQAMGRYPNDDATNGGYLTYQSGTSTTITSNAISTAPNFINAELVVRLNRFYTDRCIVTAQTSTTVTYTTQSGSTPTAGFGFFFQNSPATLDKLGEWYYNPATQKVQVVMGSTASATIKASVVDTLIKAASRSYVTIDNLALAGANDIAVAVNGGTNFTVQNSDITYSGRDAVSIAATSGFKLDGCTIDYSNSRGFDGFQANTTAPSVINNTIHNTGLFPGMGWKKAKEGVLVAIEVTTAGSLVANNTVINTGYIGIRFSGDNTVVQNNYVDTFCFIKDDGGGIYTWNGNDVVHTGMKAIDNIVKNGIGAIDGGNSTNPEAQGIYLDDLSNGIELTGNQITNVRKGIYLHDARNNTMRYNILTNATYGLATQWESGRTEIYGNIFTHNTITSVGGQYGAYINYIDNGATNPVVNVGLIDSNTYCRPSTEAATALMFKVHLPASADYSFAGWQTTYGMDIHSTRSSCQVLTGNKYYFSSGINSSDSYTTNTITSPWKTLSKLNAVFSTLAPGDTVLFKRGDVFYGTIIMNKSGSSSAPIVLTAYGTGADPVISGFTTASGWSLVATGVYESSAITAAGTEVNMVTIDGVPYAMGRFPNEDSANAGYLTLEQRNYNLITDNNKAYDASWIGSTIVVRTDHSAIDQGTITGITGNTITVDANEVDNWQYNTTQAGYGYFLENNQNTLDRYGEWYYNPTTKKLRVYFGTADNPTSHIINVSTVDSLLEPRNNYFVVRDLRFTGANHTAIWNDWAGNTDLKFINCTITNNGKDGIMLAGKTNITIDSCTFDHNNTNAISIGYHDVNCVVTNCDITNSGIFRGMLKLDEVRRSGFGIFHSSLPGALGLTAKNNYILKTGYIGIFFAGDNSLIKNNYIDSACYWMDDGAGIYTGNYTPSGQTPVVNTNNQIRYNVVTNSVGAPLGAGGVNNMAHGYYCDDNTNHIQVVGNTAANCGYSGMFVHNTNNYLLDSNTFYNNKAAQLYFQDDGLGGVLQSGTITHNKLFSKTASQNILYMQSADNNFFTFGTFNNNYYDRPFNESAIIYTNWFNHAENNYSLAQWQAVSGMDAATIKTPFPIADATHVSFYYTKRTARNLRFCNQSFKVDNSPVSGKVNLSSYNSLILLKP